MDVLLNEPCKLMSVPFFSADNSCMISAQVLSRLCGTSYIAVILYGWSTVPSFSFANVTKLLFIVALSLLSGCCVECPVVVAFVSVVVCVCRFNPVMIVFFFFAFCSISLICDTSLSILASFSVMTAVSLDMRWSVDAIALCRNPFTHHLDG